MRLYECIDFVYMNEYKRGFWFGTVIVYMMIGVSFGKSYWWLWYYKYLFLGYLGLFFLFFGDVRVFVCKLLFELGFLMIGFV